MSLESQVADLVVATTALTASVNVAKSVLDQKVTDATTQAGLANTNGATQVALAATQAAGALASKAAAAISETNSTNSANLAAGNVQAQLAAVKAQTESARDQALAGLGAADQSQSLVQLTEGIAYNADIIGQMFPEIFRIDSVNGKTLSYVLETLLWHITLALDLAGAVGKQVGGGYVQIAAGTAAEPSLWTAGDRNTGLMFPAADSVALVTAGLERLRVDASGNLGIGTNAPSGLLDLNDNRLRVRSAKTPASATAPGNAGEICWDAGFVYVCTATNVWRRTALTTW